MRIDGIGLLMLGCYHTSGRFTVISPHNPTFIRATLYWPRQSALPENAQLTSWPRYLSGFGRSISTSFEYCLPYRSLLPIWAPCQRQLPFGGILFPICSCLVLPLPVCGVFRFSFVFPCVSSPPLFLVHGYFMRQRLLQFAYDVLRSTVSAPMSVFLRMNIHLLKKGSAAPVVHRHLSA